MAAQLRRQIVLGELKEGDQLPPESVLMEEFGVSRPTLREAFRILEAEGAITVRRGVRGGARVQVPDITVAARQIGLLLQYRGALLSDVYEVRAVLEPPPPGWRPSAARRPISPGCRRRWTVIASPWRIRPPRSPPTPTSTGSSWSCPETRRSRFSPGWSATSSARAIGLYAESHDWQHEQELAKVALRAHPRLVELIRKRNGEEAEELWRKHLAESAKVVLGDRTTATVVELLS